MLFRSGSAGSAYSAGASLAGAATIFPGAVGAAAGARNTGLTGTAAAWDWFPGLPEPLLLFGAGGQKANLSGSPKKVPDITAADYGPRYGASGASSGSCIGTGCGGTTSTPGHGGGGVFLSAAGDATFGTGSTIDVSGTNGTNSAAGGSSGSVFLRYGGTLSDTATYTLTGGTSGAQCGDATNGCGGGGTGAAGKAVKVGLP